MKIYLDNCTFNRPFDSQSQIRIRLETEAKLYLQEKILNQELDLIWSYILEFENDNNPFVEKRLTISKWKRIASIDIFESEALVKRAKKFVSLGIKSKDALHISAAIEGKADFFVTTDDNLLKKLVGKDEIRVVNPLNIIGEI